MVTTQFPNQPQQEQNVNKRDNRNLVYGGLIAALLGTWGYIIYDKNKSTEQISQLQQSFSTVDNSRKQVQNEYNDALARLDSLTGSNAMLQSNLGERNEELRRKSNEIAELKTKIKNILNKQNASSTELAQARSMIKELNGKIENLYAQIDDLKQQNSQLATEKQTVVVEKQAVEKDLETTKVAKQELEGKVDVASTLHASNFAITPINVKSSGKEKETATAKRVDKLRINFDLDENRVANTGDKELFVVIYAPDGSAVTIPAVGSGTFTTREDGEKTFTSKLTISYEQGKKLPVSFDWNQGSQFQVGDYKIEVYHNGYKIGEGKTTLKKGGLFS
jgi:regulator of replication initiation timing